MSTPSTAEKEPVQACPAAPTTPAANGEDEVAKEGESLTPVIPDSVYSRFYQPPSFLHTLRPKRKVAIVFGYIGEKYCGLQWNKRPAYPTVEEALLKALYESAMITETNFATEKVQQKIDFERASRTDKGVHALRNVVSLKVMLPYDPAYVERKEKEMKEEVATGETALTTSSKPEAEADEERFSYTEAKRILNMALPADIHVYDVVPVTRSFNAYLNCGWRRYEYYLPTFCLMNKEEYSQTYFPTSLAPPKPSLVDVGVALSEAVQLAQAGVQEAVDEVPGGRVQEEGAGSSAKDDDDNNQDGENGVEWKTGGGENGYGRKSRGHFPMRKGKKQRLEAGDADKAVHEASHGEKAHGEQPNTAEGEAKEPAAPVTSESPDDKPQTEAERKGHHLPPDEATATHFHDGIFETMILFRHIPEAAMRQVAGRYRLSPAQLEHVRHYFKQYEGTECYHNFTPGGRGNDPSCNRFMKGITVSEPFVVYPDEDVEDGDGTRHPISSARIKESVEYWSPSRFFSPDDRVAQEYAARWAASGGASGVEGEEEKAAALRESILQHMTRVYGRATEGTEADTPSQAFHNPDRLQHTPLRGGIEVVRIEIEGQSFLLNQIRKMIGAVICCCATNSPAEVIRGHLLNKREKRGIPMAPANGLFLSYLNFDRYNYRLEKIQSHGANGSNKCNLELEDVSAQELEDWRARTVAVVLRNEMAEDVCGKWMRSLRCVLRLAWDTELP